MAGSNPRFSKWWSEPWCLLVCAMLSLYDVSNCPVFQSDMWTYRHWSMHWSPPIITMPQWWKTFRENGGRNRSMRPFHQSFKFFLTPPSHCWLFVFVRGSPVGRCSTWSSKISSCIRGYTCAWPGISNKATTLLRTSRWPLGRIMYLFWKTLSGPCSMISGDNLISILRHTYYVTANLWYA